MCTATRRQGDRCRENLCTWEERSSRNASPHQGKKTKGRKSRFGQLNVIMKVEYNSKDKVELTLGDLATLDEIT